MLNKMRLKIVEKPCTPQNAFFPHPLVLCLVDSHYSTIQDHVIDIYNRQLNECIDAMAPG